MSDLFLSTDPATNAGVLNSELRFSDRTHVETGVDDGFAWAVSRVDDFGLWGPAWDARSQVRILLGGRVALEESEWAAAEKAPFVGGLAARHLLARWLHGGVRALAEFNGAAVVIVLEPQDGRAHVFTDRLGFFPIFARNERHVTLCSHPDLIARLEAHHGRPPAVDAATIAELLHTGSPSHKHSLWTGIRHLDPASHYVVHSRPSGVLEAGQAYWRPAHMDGAAPLPRRAFVDAFAEALRAAGRRRTQGRLGKVALLLSAGADSRAVLGAAAHPSEVDCYTYYDEPNPELAGAHKIAALAHARHIPLHRAPDYYVAHAEETVRLSGGMWGIDGGHHTGFVDAIQQTSDPGVLLTGEFCDVLFKGVTVNRRHYTLFGKNLPLFAPAPFEHEYYLPLAPVADAWMGAVNARLDEATPPAARNDQRLVQWLRSVPVSRFGAASSILVLWRTMPFDSIFADRDVAEIYGRMSVADMVSGIAFGQAVAKVAGPRIAAVPNNNFGSPVGTDEVGRLISFLLASAGRKLRGVSSAGQSNDPNSVATVGSWPNLTKVALNSAPMRAWFRAIPDQCDGLLCSMLPPERRAWSYEQFATGDKFQFYRLITASLWLRRAAELIGAEPKIAA